MARNSSGSGRFEAVRPAIANSARCSRSERPASATARVPAWVMATHSGAAARSRRSCRPFLPGRGPLRDRRGPPEQIALAKLAAELDERVALRLRLDAFGDRVHAERAGERKH